MKHQSRIRGTAATATAVAVALSLTLAGCSGGSDDSASADGKTTLTFASWIPTSTQWPDMVAEFEKENPDITIDYTNAADYTPYIADLDNKILADEVPDLFGIQPGASFEDYAEYAMDASEYDSSFIDDIQESTLSQTTTEDGTLKAIPLITAGSEFYLYNQTILDKLGLALPTNYDEVVTVAKAARAAGYSPFAMGAADAWHDNDFFVWLSNQYGDGGDVYKAAAGDIPWDSPSLVDAATRWQDLFTDGVFQDGATSTTTYPSARDDYFLPGKSVFMPTGSWHVSAALSNSTEVPGTAVENDDIGMAPFPTIGDHDGGTTTGVDFGLAISDTIDPAKLDAATKFVEFMATGSGQQYWVDHLQGFPVAKDIEIQIPDDEKQLGKDSVKAVADALAASTYPRKVVSESNPSLETDLGVVLQNIAGGADPQSELATLNE
ncbi:ABC transporter substrate-binding protein [Herbiconiux sp. P16]|uniref:ABC transporter substrate-binding protein n=1 Tax=Herbiconiux wuyangfengii TaxID=3342794 RepID=UPI0035B87C24